MYSELFQNLHTTYDRTLLLQELNLLLQSLYKTNEERYEVVIERNIRASTREIIKKFLDPSTNKEPSVKEVIIKQIIIDLNTIKTIQMTVALELPLASIEKISRWFETNLSTKLLIDFQIDPSLVAGSTIVIDGKYFDFSFGSKLSELAQQYHAQLQS